ncbi:MAG: type II secretion system protein [Alphaproteobacteria bacterium]|nr:type II secretion system protein [Alphaproteobacteria bacterium]
MKRRLQAQAGVTLLEVLVAFIIIAMATTVALQTSSISITASTKSSDAAHAALRARSLLAEFGVSRPLEEREISGRLDANTTWSARISRLPSPTPLLRAHALSVTVIAGKSRVMLETHRLSPTRKTP